MSVMTFFHDKYRFIYHTDDGKRKENYIDIDSIKIPAFSRLLEVITIKEKTFMR